jgi:hypothetical protein
MAEARHNEGMLLFTTQSLASFPPARNVR